MHVIVCIKSVPDTTQVRFDPETNTLLRSEVASIINPLDMYAIEEALRLKDAHGGTVTALTMGPPQAEKELRDALAMGCDEAVLLSAREFAGADTWATAYVLSQAIRRLGAYDLIVCGKQAIDGDTGQVGPGIANQLGLPQLTYVSRIAAVDPAARTIRVERLLEEGREVVEAGLPALLTVVKDINSPRYPSLRGLRAARRKEIPVWTAADLPACDLGRVGLEGSPTRVVRVFSPPQREGEATILQGQSPEAAAERLVDLLRQERVI